MGVLLATMVGQYGCASPLPQRVEADFNAAQPQAQVLHYVVPPMSGTQYLPSAYPVNGKLGAPVRIVMAKDEYEPGSFLLCARKDFDKVQLSLSSFKNEKGQEFPADDLDLKVIKVWYQNGNAWYSYFGDTGFKLVPELLLNDENLIRVDETKQANYARLTEKDGRVHERWLNPPRQMNDLFWDNYRGGGGFSCMKPNFADADTLQPVALKAGAFKQFFLTAHAKSTASAGIYRGEVRVKGGGVECSIPVEIKVLDFVLPKPMCYGDASEPFYVSFYGYDCFFMIGEENGGDLELAKRQFRAVLADRVAHGHDITWFRWGFHNGEAVEKLKAMKATGCRDDLYVSMAPDIDRVHHSQVLIDAHNRRSYEAARRFLGDKCQIYGMYTDEPSAEWLKQNREQLRSAQKAGFKFIIAGSDNLYRKVGHQVDWHNINCAPESDATTKYWNQFGSKPHVAWYAYQHVGTENPDFNRRQNGLAPYLAGYTALCNYAHHFGSYNDDAEGYKPMVFAYGQYKGVIDTLQWEGFREGLDDIRYATKLVTMARKAAASKNVEARDVANRALQFLATFRRDADSLDEARMEMINFIQALSAQK